MKISRYLPLSLLALALSCGRGGNYTHILTLKEGNYTVKLYSSNGEINVGINKIKVEVDPPVKIRKLYLYMPPMPGMPEMRAIADLKETGKGRYEGKVSVSMEGSWQVIAEVNGKTLRQEISVPFKGGETAGSKMKHGMKHAMEDSAMSMENVLTVPESKLTHFNVVTFKVDSTIAPVTVRAAGVIRYAPGSTFDVSPRFSGYIVRLFVDREGRNVAEGTPLFEFYSPEIIRAYGEYEVARGSGDSLSMMLAEEKLRLYGVSPEDVRDTVAVFRSPVSGKVSSVNAFVGKRFVAGAVLYRIYGRRVFYFVGEVPQSMAKHIGTGDMVEVDGRMAKITEVSPSVNMKTKTVRFVAVFAGGDFYDGEVMMAKVKREVRGIFVPLDAVIRTGDMAYVYVRKGKNVFAIKHVKVVSPVEGGYMVEGLMPGDEVVARGVFFVDAEASFRGTGGGHGGH